MQALVTPASSNAPSGPGEITGLGAKAVSARAAPACTSPAATCDRPWPCLVEKNNRRRPSSADCTTGSDAWEAAQAIGGGAGTTSPCFFHLTSEVQIPTLDFARLRPLDAVDASFDRVLHDQRRCPDDAPGRNGDAVAKARVDADEAGVSDRHIARDDDVGGDEAVVADGRVVTDVVPAPQDDVVADADVRLDHVRLEDKAVVADHQVARRHGLRTHVCDQSVTPRLAIAVHLGAGLVDAGE